MLAFVIYFLIFSFLCSVLVATAQCDLTEPWQLACQDPASPVMEGIVNLHNDVITILLFVLGLVTIIMGAGIYLFATTRYIPAPTYMGLIHNTNLAFVWTLIRCVILLLIALPSFSLIYALDDLINTEILTLMLPGGWVVRPLGWTRGGLYQTTKHPLYFSPGKPFGNQHTSLAGDASGLLANAPEYYCATALRKYRIEFIIFYRLSTTPGEEEMLLSEYASLNSIQNNCGCRGWCSGLPFKIKT